MAETAIEWTDWSLNPIRFRNHETGGVGHYCEKIAPGCAHCYAAKLQKRFRNPIEFNAKDRDKGELFLDEKVLDQARRRKTPTSIFWCDMTDMFGEWVKAEWIQEIFKVFDETPQHRHLVLTKRISRVLERWPSTMCTTCGGTGEIEDEDHPMHPKQTGDGLDETWCLACEGDGTNHFRPNVAIGTSISDQETADKWLDELRKLRDVTPCLFVSAEPLLGPLDLSRYLPHLDWVITGGESGPNARVCCPEWIHDIGLQCRSVGVPWFSKQLGANLETPNVNLYDWQPSQIVCDEPPTVVTGAASARLRLKDKKGGDMSEWPKDLRVRELPTGRLFSDTSKT